MGDGNRVQERADGEFDVYFGDRTIGPFPTKLMAERFLAWLVRNEEIEHEVAEAIRSRADESKHARDLNEFLEMLDRLREEIATRQRDAYQSGDNAPCG